MEILNDLSTQMKLQYFNIIEILPKVLIGLIISLIFLFVAKFLKRRLVKFIGQKVEDPLLVNFINSVIKISIFIIAVLIFLSVIGAGGVAASIMGAAGVSAFVIGFAFKDIGENFIAGVILAFNRPFRLGDVIKSGGVEGVVIKEMSLRDTHLKTFDGKDVYVPNGQILKEPLYNYTIDGFLRKDFVVGIEYDADIDLAKNLVLKAISEVPGIILDEKEPAVFISELGASSIQLNVHFWINTFEKKYSSLDIKTEAIQKVIRALGKNGIEMPGDVIELKKFKGGSI